MFSTAFLRGLPRTVIARMSGACTWPLRRLTWRLMAGNPALARRAGRWSWLWQPGWSEGVYETHYRIEEDPDRLAVRTYEQDKFRHQLSLIEGRRFERALEVGCAEGIFTEMLAGRCDELVGTDISETAVGRGRTRCARFPGVRFERHNLPFDMPDGDFDLIVCSDVLYLWEPITLGYGIRELRARLRPGGMFLLQHFLGDFGQATTADLAHDTVLTSAGDPPALRHLHHDRRTGISPWGQGGPGYRIDLFQRVDPDHDGTEDSESEIRRRITR